ncbi:unnamed protein product [Nezara viridula]|uniref:Uncharacterized protein n=1 Tax=Nezara viridula TaxID=85310 RepID=A0A9P0MS58_NEZVI|nr:unnamed protein product [Nezara viridula]
MILSTEDDVESVLSGLEQRSLIYYFSGGVSTLTQLSNHQVATPKVAALLPVTMTITHFDTEVILNRIAGSLIEGATFQLKLIQDQDITSFLQLKK